jgi:hypothetical protein
VSDQPPPGAGAGGRSVSLLVRAIEDAIRNDPVESLHAFDAAGSLLLTKTGGAREIELSLIKVARLRDAVLTYNHPANTAFSLNEVQAAMVGDLAAIHVVTARWRYSLVRPPTGWSQETFERSLRPAHERHREAVLREFLIAINADHMTEEEANTLYTHEVWTRVCSELALEFQREPWVWPTRSAWTQRKMPFRRSAPFVLTAHT